MEIYPDTDRYNILVKGKTKYNDLTTDEFFDKIQDMADNFYANKGPGPDQVSFQYNSQGSYGESISIGSTYPQRPTNTITIST